MESLLRATTESALEAGDFERARALLSIALKYDLAVEADELRTAFVTQTHTPSLRSTAVRPLLQLWNDRAPPEQRDASFERLAARPAAYDRDAIGSQETSLALPALPAQPFRSWARPTHDEIDAMLQNSVFKRGADRSEQEAEEGRGLLSPDAVGKTSCDLVAALVQLLLGAPFSPNGFGDDMLLALLDALRIAVSDGGGAAGASADGTATVTSDQLSWARVADLSERRPPRASPALAMTSFSMRSTQWLRAAGARAPGAFTCPVRHPGSGPECRLVDDARLAPPWILAVPCEPWWRSRASPYQLRRRCSYLSCTRPVLPLCTNALLEARNCGWIPPNTGVIAATLQLNARMPKEHAKVRALYSCLCQQHAYRLTRHAVVGDGSKAPVDLALREQGATILHLGVRLTEKRAVNAGVEDGRESRVSRSGERKRR